jgi:hypothetical protein
MMKIAGAIIRYLKRRSENSESLRAKEGLGAVAVALIAEAFMLAAGWRGRASESLADHGEVTLKHSGGRAQACPAAGLASDQFG